MVQIPQYTQQVGIEAPSRDIPNVVQPTDGGIGQAISSLGSAITNVAEAAQARQKRLDAFNAQVNWDTFQEEAGQTLTEMERNAQGNGQGVHDGFMKWYQEQGSKVLNTITDPELRQKYGAVFERSGLEHWSSQAANSEWKISNTYTVNTLMTTGEKAKLAIAQDPSTYEGYMADVHTRIMHAPDLTPEQRTKMWNDFKEQGPKFLAAGLEQSDPETYRYLMGLGTHDERIDFLSRRAAAVFPGADPAQVKAAVAKHHGDVGAALGDVADDMGVKEKDKAAFIEKGLAGMGAARYVSGAVDPKQSSSAPVGGGSAAQLVAHYEGFRTTAYWDVNHYRTGFGSDTVTRADGTVEKVTKGTTVTRADAERDLQRRVGETQQKLAGQIPGWGSLPEGAKAALTSVAYNYGTLPGSVLAAARSGDPQRISQAIQSLSEDNGGVNSRRRGEEAQIALGGAMPKGRVQVADASGTGGLPASDAGPQYADGVPGDAPARSGFVSPIFDGMSAADYLSMQHDAAKGYATTEQARLVQDTSDQILAQAGATGDRPGDYATAMKMVDAINDPEVKKDVTALVDSHFTRWDKIQKDQQQKTVADTWSSVEAALAQNDTNAAFTIAKRADISAEERAKLMERISKGPVQYDDPKIVEALDAMRLNPEVFTSVNIRGSYRNQLTEPTIVSYEQKQAEMMKAKQTAADALTKSTDAAAVSAANQINETNSKANDLVTRYFLETGIPTDAKKMTPDDAQHANFVRAQVARELEVRQQASKTPLTITEITDAVDSVMKAYPRNSAVSTTTWYNPWTWGTKDADVNFNEVLSAYKDAGLDPDAMAAAIRKKGLVVNAQTMQQMLDSYNASKAPQ